MRATPTRHGDIRLDSQFGHYYHPTSAVVLGFEFLLCSLCVLVRRLKVTLEEEVFAGSSFRVLAHCKNSKVLC